MTKKMEGIYSTLHFKKMETNHYLGIALGTLLALAAVELLVLTLTTKKPKKPPISK